MSTGTQTWFYKDQLDSLLVLAGIMPPKKLSVLRSLMKFLQPDTLKSTATREQIRNDTGLGLSTIYRYIREFIAIGLLNQWRGPFDKKQCYYRLNLPVASSVLEFYARSPRKTATESSEQVAGSLVHHEVGPERRAHVSHQEVAERSTTLSSCQVDHPDEAENLSAGEIPILQDEGPGPACTGSTAAQLHPDISAVMDKLERTCQRTDAADFLTVMGFLEPQLSSDEKIVIDRKGLLALLLDRNANFPDGFCKLVAEEQNKARERWRAAPTPYVPKWEVMPEPAPVSELELRPGELPCNAVRERWMDAYFSDEVVGSEEEAILRHCQEKFDREYAHVTDSKFKTREREAIVSELVFVGKKYPALVGYQPKRGATALSSGQTDNPDKPEHLTEGEIPVLQGKGSASPCAVPTFPQLDLDLTPGELNCDAILDRFAYYYRSGCEDVIGSDEEEDLYRRCQVKVDREYGQMTSSRSKTFTREGIIELLMPIARRNPALVGYQPRRGDVGERECPPCC